MTSIHYFSPRSYHSTHVLNPEPTSVSHSVRSQTIFEAEDVFELYEEA